MTRRIFLFLPSRASERTRRMTPTLLLVLAATVGCTKPEGKPGGTHSSPAPTAGETAPEKAEAPAPTATEKTNTHQALGQTYGKPLSQRDKTLLSDVLDRPDEFEGKTVLVEGHVRRACSRKGCWMEIATESGDEAPGCRVTFQDYAFFVPTNSQGKHATVEATVNVHRVTPGRVEHLESEGGTFRKKNPDGSADEVQLTASGVVLVQG